MNGVNLKVEDDTTIKADFGEVVMIQDEYWKMKEDLLVEYIGQYEDQM